jgi:hypothetical protein
MITGCFSQLAFILITTRERDEINHSDYQTF